MTIRPYQSLNESSGSGQNVIPFNTESIVTIQFEMLASLMDETQTTSVLLF